MFKRIIEGKQNHLETVNSEFSAASFAGMGKFEESYLEYNEREKLKA
jgi:hypothetical protein